MSLKRYWYLVLIIAVAAFFYIFRLQDTFILATDTARDLVRVIQIWQNKELTMIGPPLNTINNKPIEVFFGSMHYYFGIMGLIISNFNPIGSVYLNIFLTLASIPFFYLLTKYLTRNKMFAIISSLVYALSPVTLSFVRSYWNPNLILPLSVFLWFCLLYKESLKKYFIAGLISGVILNLHYMDFAPIAFYFILLLFKRDKRYPLSFFVGTIIALTPLIAFEIKNNLFLTKAFFSNLGGFSTFAARTFNPLLSMDTFFYIIGLGPPDFYISSLINLSYLLRFAITTTFGIFFIYFLVKKQKILNKTIVATILVGLLTAWYLETWHIIHIRYILSIYPLLIISFIYFLSSLSKAFVYMTFIPIALLSLNIITYKLDPSKDYYPIDKVETISKEIAKDSENRKYNVTENILGDARSLAYRYYLLKDAKTKPQIETNYKDIEVLYVISPSLEKTYKENRWEFDVAPTKKISWEKDFGELKLFKFVR